jgi:probable rRNA maturation factor
MPKGLDIRTGILNESGRPLPLRRSKIEQTIRNTLRAAGVPATAYEISVYLIDDTEMRRLNKIHRGLNRTTDVLSFPQYESANSLKTDIGGVALMGDIVISLETLHRRCVARDERPEREFARLLVHGTLHLLGYDHSSSRDRAHMLELEDTIVDTVYG